MIPGRRLIAAAMAGDAFVTLRIVIGDPAIAGALCTAGLSDLRYCCMRCHWRHEVAASRRRRHRRHEQFVIDAEAAKEFCHS
jgi:hypothetical protein